MECGRTAYHAPALPLFNGTVSLQMKRIIIEIVLILLISMFLSLLYNAVSPAGIKLFPGKALKGAEMKKGVWRTEEA